MALPGFLHKSRTAYTAYYTCLNPVLNFSFAWANNPNWISAANTASADGAGFAAFGKVISGMDVVHKIHQSPAREQTLEPGIAITGVKLASRWKQ